MASPKRILIAHGDRKAGNKVRALAQNRLGLVGTVQAHNFDTMIKQLCDASRTDLVIVDLDLPGMFWEVGLRHLLAKQKAIRIAVLFSGPDREKLRPFENKFAALVPKNLPRRELREVLGQLLEGKDFRPIDHEGPEPGVVPVLRKLPSTSPCEPFLPVQSSDFPLTRRQIDVLRLLSEGYSNHEIAGALAIADGTVKVHINAAFRILGVHNRVSAASAFRHYVERLPG